MHRNDGPPQSPIPSGGWTDARMDKGVHPRPRILFGSGSEGKDIDENEMDSAT